MKPTAIVTGMIATYPVGGVAWDYGQYALGLERLGFDVVYLEDTGWKNYDPRVREYTEDAAYGAEFLRHTLTSLSPDLGARLPPAQHGRQRRTGCRRPSSAMRSTTPCCS